MGDKRSCVNLPFRDKPKYFIAVATIDSTCLERQILARTALGTDPCLICKSLVQILLRVILSTASVASTISGFAFSVTSNRPLPIYVNAFMTKRLTLIGIISLIPECKVFFNKVGVLREIFIPQSIELLGIFFV